MNAIRTQRLAFGPALSRRLGWSLGINNVPPRWCTYSCVYCQLGRTGRLRVKRERFYAPDEIFGDVAARVARCRSEKSPPDFLSFVPDGEPTLDARLGREIDWMKMFGIRVAVLTNASLLWQRPVRDALGRADWVSVKIDAVAEAVWRRINRPHGVLRLEKILRGILAFRRSFRGTLATETMLVAGVNDGEADIRALARFLATLKPRVSYLSMPTRPPAEPWVRPPAKDIMDRAAAILREEASWVEILSGGEATDFESRNLSDLIGLLNVHPMREDAVRAFLRREGIGRRELARLVHRGVIARRRYGRDLFFARSWAPPVRAPAPSPGEAP